MSDDLVLSVRRIPIVRDRWDRWQGEPFDDDDGHGVPDNDEETS